MIDRLARSLAADPIAPPGDGKRRAAVAAVLRTPTDRTSDAPAVLLMKRAERTSDPWSGHISLPGGGHQESDPTLLATAIRESREELGLELARARVLGSLPVLSPMSSGPYGIEVTPFVFVVDGPLEPALGPEAAAAFWLPLELAASGHLDDKFTYPGTGMSYPAWRYEGHTIWGLTWRILGDLISRGR